MPKHKKIITERSVTINRVVRERHRLRVGKQVYCTILKDYVRIVFIEDDGAVVAKRQYDAALSKWVTRYEKVAYATLVPNTRTEYTRVN